ncbi:hypothetical protein [Paenibacillus chitinolyticus]|uniref:hypothetical protein n=1 Tax=Paenibacillus chitinolyticus TaxID=79263 RepID=UPI001C436AA3|nr:hypothetical protein [Paenibacillus chitinolyticus]MBV6714868.1 hypothetical protein [Paenibacillus chitinolyticus]
MLDKTSDIKSIYADIKGLLSDVDLLSLLTITAIIIKLIIPEKLSFIEKSLNPKLVDLFIGISDLSFCILSIFIITLFIFHFFFNVANSLMHYIGRNSRVSIKMLNRMEFFSRAFAGTHVRFILVSRWYLVSIGILYLTNNAKFIEYSRIISSLCKDLDNTNLFVIVSGILFAFMILQGLWFTLKSIHYKYLDINTLIKEENITVEEGK